MRELTSWLSGTSDPDRFPYAAVLERFHRVGKHFVEKELLALLDEVRARVTPTGADTTATGLGAGTRLLADFLDVALDKWDGRYDYRTYLGLRLLGRPDGPDAGLPGQGSGPRGEDRRPPGEDFQPPGEGDGAGWDVDPAGVRQGRDRLLVGLVADALAFELAAASGATDLLPEQRPTPELVVKRCRLGVRAVSSTVARLGLAEPPADREPPAAAAALHAGITADQDSVRELVLRLSMLPVYVSHDEYLFIRVLQAYECLFAGLVDELRATIAALSAGHARPAADRLAYASGQLTTASPLFSLLATMQPESFRTFRQYTEGASAIQSRSYKLMESLCRTPEGVRLDSAAYRSVPEVRDRVRAGQPSVDDAFRAAVRDGRLDGPDRDLVQRRMRAFAEAVLQWRRTHHRLATRMLGPRPGTGYTEGTPYLAATRAIPVFTAVPDGPRPSPTDPTGGSPE
ncbi:tryptophan 2,3-dioxygenase family protein [Micromonospora narathiwatensis]|uniref:Tryptophan 2,3-dioxygenase (Vermilion) n=1 Tax=Micromonospora narathiwatensis TaxID=299146 RepID=A0A1A8ZL86_9ACTN|nr:tryptophan 2,3-dioxygenase family protein [Micromonospora narathiwatensis]SBT44638.1 Tryptophan 2,3-dioxygenase (vermilion) [Micromonospora narathiwatensis]